VNGDNLCQYLDWDSNFFGFRIARCTQERLTPESVQAIIDWCKFHRIDCLYFLGDVSDGSTIILAHDNKFRLMDIRLEFENNLGNFSTEEDALFSDEIRQCSEDDIAALRAMAGVNHHDSRFYYDKRFPTSLCNALYETWIEKSCRGYADVVFVSTVQGKPAGYCSCHIREQNIGEIGLLGVGSNWQGMGLSQKLIDRSLAWFAARGVTRVKVVTQGRNFSAQRLYQRKGFLTRSMQLWYHRWFSPQKSK